jgi:hydroxypyruvate isomerase
MHIEPNGAKREPGRLRLSVAARNFGSVPIATSLERVASAGFDACDNFDWRNQEEFAQFQKYLKEFGLGAGVLVVNKKPDVNALGCSLVSPEDRPSFLKELQLCIDAAHTVGCSTLEVLSGNSIPGVSHADQMDSCAATLEAAAPRLAANGMTAVVELLNSNVDHPGYFLDQVETAVELMRRIADPNIRLLFDIYHVQVMQGNLIQTIRDTFDCVGQYHFADVPGRHEPGTGEINFRNVFKAIYDLNYHGYVTAEYHPTDFTFRDLAAVRELATF